MNDQEKNELFLLACTRGLIEDANDLLAHGVKPTVVDTDKRSGAHFAAAKGELEILQLLYSKGVDVDAEDNLGRSPLHYAALHDHESVISFLALKSAWLDACDGTDCSALHLAARVGAAAAASRLVKLGASPNLRNQWDLTAFGEATFRGHTSVCKALKQAGAILTDQDPVRVNGGYTLYHIAAASGHTDTLNWLLSHSGYFNKHFVNDNQNPEQLTPLHCMVLTGTVGVAGIQMLAKAGANLSTRDAKGRTPLLIMQAAVATPELTQSVAAVCKDTLYQLHTLLTPKKAILDTATFGTEVTNKRYKAFDDVVVAPGDEGYSAHEDAGLSIAARLQAASCPEHVAAILQSVQRCEQVHRVKLWAKLNLEEIRGLSSLTPQSKLCLEQVHLVTQAISRVSAEGCLRRDERFQEAMHNPAVRRIVDAVIRDPHKGPLVRDQEGLACLYKLRGLRDVLSLHGGGQINLTEVLRPWDNQDVQREAGMSAALESNIEAAIGSLCNPTADCVAAQLNESDDRISAMTRKLTASEIQPAPPRERRDSGASAGWESEVDLHWEDAVTSVGQQPSVWQQTLKRILQQLVVAGIILAVFFTQGKFTHQ